MPPLLANNCLGLRAPFYRLYMSFGSLFHTETLAHTQAPLG